MLLLPSIVSRISPLLAVFSLVGVFSLTPVVAQSILPAADGTQTIVTPQGNLIRITGGKTSADGTNLFQSFSQFGLNTGQIADFQSNPAIQNILGRVVGGNASIINGLIQVTGSNANLYLMNPAGMVFGRDAQLNVPASFFATTATGIGFGNNWFNATGNNNYIALNGTPNSFAFTTPIPGNIVNAASLAVPPGQSLTLLGGTVINTGEMSAPGGQITLSSVPGQKVVRLSQTGYLLNLEIQPLAQSSTPNYITFTPLSLPELLTGEARGQATGLTVNSDGTVQLTGGINIPTESGTTIVTGRLNTSSTLGGTVNVLGDKVGVIGGNIDASGTNGGGRVLIGGDYQGKGTVTKATRTYVSSNSVINADSLVDGNGGHVVVWADQLTGFYGNISARGGANSGNGGFVEVSGKQDLTFNGQVNTGATNGLDGILLLDPTDITISNAPSSPGVDVQLNGTAQILQNDFSPIPGAITISQATLEGLPNTSTVILEATNNINIGTLTGNQLTFASLNGGGGAIIFRADADNSGTGSFLMNSTQSIVAPGRNITISGAGIALGTLATGGLNGGNINLSASGNITAFRLGSGTNGAGIGGSVIVTSTAGAINITDAVETGSAGAGLGSGGDITLSARDNVTTSNVLSRSNSVGSAGNITITSIEGSIDTTAATFGVHAFGQSGGTITLNAQGDIRTGSILSSTTAGSTGNAGNITLNSSAGNISNTISINSSSVSGNAGAIALSAAGNISSEILDSRSGGAGRKGGDITVNSGGNFTAPNVISVWQGRTTGDGGSINITAGGDISSQSNILSFTNNGNGGSITLTAGGNIFVDDIFSIGSLSSGNIDLISGGTIDTTLANSTPGVIWSCSGRGSTCGGSGRGGNITLAAPTRIATGINATGALGGGDIILTSNEIDNLGISSNGGTLLLQPFTPSQNIAIGSTTNNGANTLDLTTTDLTALSSGFSSITIGRADSTGIITLNPFNFNTPVNIAGGSTLIGTNQNTTWNITDANQGNLNSIFPNTLTFNNIENISGGSGNDNFVFSNGASISGIIYGNGGTNTLDYSALTTSLTINTETLAAINIQQVIGTTAASSTLVGKNTANTWNLTGSNSGTVSGLTFSAFQNLTGGNSNDTFIFNNGSSITGNLDGGAGDLTLIGDELAFGGRISGTGNLFLQPLTPSQQIRIGGADSGNANILDLTEAKISSLQNGFNSITIGQIDGSGAITLAGDTTFNNPVILTNNSINTQGFSLTGANNATITLLANQDITTGTIINPGRAITITSNNGNINATGIIDTSTTGNGGVINLSAADNITTNNILANSATAQGGDITLNSQQGVVNSGNLNSSGNTNGGKITVIAREQITVGQINSSAILGNGGDVTLDPIGDIQVDFINAQGGHQGTGGKVDIATQSFFRATDSFLDQNGITSSISTAGGIDGGEIIIQHGGGFINPFVVRDSVTNNGTVGNITTGSGLDDTLLPDTYLDSVSQGKIQIITTGSDIVNAVLRDIQIEPERQARSALSIDKISTTTSAFLNTSEILRNNINKALANGQIEVAIPLIEELRGQEYQNYLESDTTQSISDQTTSSPTQLSLEQTQNALSTITTKTGKKPAIIYAITQPEQLQLILVTPDGKPILKTIREANRETLVKKVKQFRAEITDFRKNTAYLNAKQLYQWLITPIEAELKARNIDTLAFSLDSGLRLLPLAGLHDGQQFLVEKYSLALIPSINLTNTNYQDIKQSKVLAMGASKFTEQNALPAVPVELSNIVGNATTTQNQEQTTSTTKGLWRGEAFLNEEFTLMNLKSQRAKDSFGIIHLATHGEFKPGTASNSYIQLWDTRLPLDQLRQLGWNNPPVELLVLSACRTAVGDENVELGFAGLAVAAGVKSVVASLWYVSDEGTLGLMSEFYQQLKTSQIKAEALRQAQIAMIKGQVRITGGKLQYPGASEGVALPSELAEIGDKTLSHPAYWAAFTLIGSPW